MEVFRRYLSLRVDFIAGGVGSLMVAARSGGAPVSENLSFSSSRRLNMCKLALRVRMQQQPSRRSYSPRRTAAAAAAEVKRKSDVKDAAASTAAATQQRKQLGSHIARQHDNSRAMEFTSPRKGSTRFSRLTKLASRCYIFYFFKIHKKQIL